MPEKTRTVSTTKVRVPARQTASARHRETGGPGQAPPLSGGFWDQAPAFTHTGPHAPHPSLRSLQTRPRSQPWVLLTWRGETGRAQRLSWPLEAVRS